MACSTCGKLVDLGGFKDEESRREFAITGTCQTCQDEIFAEPEHEPGDEECPHCGSTVCYVAQIPGPLVCGNTGKIVLAENEF